jgi:hypothetical protein
MNNDYYFYLVPIICILTILLLLSGGVSLYNYLNGYEEVCEVTYEDVCYKVGCSGWGCSSGRVDCDSPNVDKREVLEKKVCKLVKKNEDYKDD